MKHRRLYESMRKAGDALKVPLCGLSCTEVFFAGLSAQLGGNINYKAVFGHCLSGRDSRIPSTTAPSET